MSDHDERFAEFVRTRAPALYRYAYLLTGSTADADDLVQEALIRLRGAWPRLRNADDPVGYARTTVARLHVSIWRRRRRETVVSEPPDVAVEEPGYAASARRAGILAALDALPPRQRAVIVLRFYEDLSEQQIADALGVSRSTVRSQTFRALEKLRVMRRLELTEGGW